MRKCSLEQLVPGMITAEDIISIDGEVIIPQGIVLTQNIILKLASFAIFAVKVEDDMITSGGFYSPKKKSLREQIADSQEFHEFKKQFEDYVDNFKDTINQLVLENSSTETDKLIAQMLKPLINFGDSSTYLHMLLNMRDYDDSTYAHCVNVALITNIFAGWLKFSKEDRELATLCGLFHDIGKLNTPDHIIKKPGKLTDAEFEIMKQHPIEGYRILKKTNLPTHILESALMHHEKCDGSGYPGGRHTKEINRFAKLITIVDIYDAMTSKRIYREPICPFTVISIFENEGLQKYDPGYILVFLENMVNSFINHRVRLSNGAQGNIIYINPVSLARPTIKCDEHLFDLSAAQYKTLEIEEII